MTSEEMLAGLEIIPSPCYVNLASIAQVITDKIESDQPNASIGVGSIVATKVDLFINGVSCVVYCQISLGKQFDA